MEKWASRVVAEFEEENLMRIHTEWVL